VGHPRLLRVRTDRSPPLCMATVVRPALFTSAVYMMCLIIAGRCLSRPRLVRVAPHPIRGSTILMPLLPPGFWARGFAGVAGAQPTQFRFSYGTVLVCDFVCLADLLSFTDVGFFFAFDGFRPLYSFSRGVRRSCFDLTLPLDGETASSFALRRHVVVTLGPNPFHLFFPTYVIGWPPCRIVEGPIVSAYRFFDLFFPFLGRPPGL